MATTTNTTERLAKLRALMPQHQVQAIIVPSEDQHASEYIADCDERRAYISGFTGSAGCAVITHDKALLFTDGRYYLQASQQLDHNWTLMKVGVKDVPTWQEYLAKDLTSTAIGVDATLLSIADAESLEKSLAPKSNTLVSLRPQDNLVDAVWLKRPARPNNPVIQLDVKYAGKSAENKIQELREHIKTKSYGAHVVTALDEVAWLFNLRGSDIAFNPVFFAYAVVTQDEVLLFADIKDTSVLPQGVSLKSYNAFWDYLPNLGAATFVSADKPVLLSQKTSLAVANFIGKDKTKSERPPITDAKAIKNETEILAPAAS